jgi:hypothetical protein
MAKTCEIPKVDQEIEAHIIKRQNDVYDAYDNVFGEGNRITNYGLQLTKNEIEVNDEEIASIEMEIASEESDYKTVDRKKVSKLQEKINDLKKDNKKLKSEFNNDSKKEPWINSIRDKIEKAVLEIMDIENYNPNYDPSLVMNVIKEQFIETKYTDTFYSIDELDSTTLASIDRSLAKKLYGKNGWIAQSKVEAQKQKELENNPDIKIEDTRLKSTIFNKLFGDGNWGNWNNTILHPLVVASEFDYSGYAYKVVKAATELASNAFASRASKEEVIANVFERLNNLTSVSNSNPIMFMHNMGSRIIPDFEDTRKSLQNMYNLITDLGRGTVRQIVPTPMMGRKQDGSLNFTDEFAEDHAEYMRLINTNAGNGIGAAGWIQEYIDENDKKHYYVLIKKKITGDDGVVRELYRAYDAPIKYFKTASGGKKLTIEKSPGKGNKEFWKEVFALRQDGIGGFRKYDASTGQMVDVPGRMKRGYYKARKHETVKGKINWNKDKRKEGQEFQMNTDTNFTWYEELNNEGVVPAEVWRSLGDIRQVFKETFADVKAQNQRQEEELLVQLQKMFPEEDFTNANLGKDDIGKMIKEKYGFNVDTLDMNIAIRGGKVYTNNTDYDELVNYWPIKYTDPDRIRMFVQSILDLDHTIEDLEAQVVELSNRDDQKSLDKAIIIKNDIVDFKEIRTHEKLLLQYWAGEIDEIPTFNQITQIKATKHRSTLSTPLPLMDEVDVPTGKPGEYKREKREVHSGMRRDSQVINDYLQETYTAIEQNNVKISLLEAVASGQMASSMQDYVVDHVKSSFGRKDIKAGFFGIDYSDERLNIKDNGAIGSIVSLANKLMSGNLLQGENTSKMNNMQRIGYAGVTALKDVWDASVWSKNEENAKRLDRAAAAAGVNDEIATLTDVLIGNSKVRDDFFGGAFEGARLKMHLLLSQANSSKSFARMARKNKLWMKLATTMARNVTDQDAKVQQTIDGFFEDTWELTVGLRTKNEKSILDDSTRKAMVKKLSRYYNQKTIDQYVQWAFSGGMSTRLKKPLTYGPAVKFTDSEKKMRKESLWLAKNKLVEEGRIPKDWVGENGETDKLYHPQVQRLARIMVNNVMFSMSRANLSKVFKGSVGEVLTKFKPYQWNQIGAEYNIIVNWFNARASLSGEERTQLLKDLIWQPIRTKKLNQVESQMQTLLFNRALASVAISGIAKVVDLTALGGLGHVTSKVKKMFGYQEFGAMTRGAESQLVSSVLRGLIFTIALGNEIGEDEEDKVYEQTFRHFLPVLFNVIYDSIDEGNPLKFSELYFRNEYRSAKDVYDWYNRD